MIADRVLDVVVDCLVTISVLLVQVQRGGLGGRPEPIELDDSDLVWSSDRGFFYANYETTNLNTIPRLRGGRTVSVPVDQDEQFMAWMRPYSGPSALTSLLFCCW